MADAIQNYTSLSDMFSAINRAGVRSSGYAEFGGRDTADAQAYIIQGASEQEQRTTLSLLDKINASVEQRERVEFIPSVAGSRVSVADYLQGMPTHMRKRSFVEHEAAPVRVVVETLVSEGVTPQQMAKRGAAIAALVMRLSETRPVELYASWAMQAIAPRGYRRQVGPDVIGKVKLDTSPVSLSHLVAVLESKEFCRRITIDHMTAMGAEGWRNNANWAWNKAPTDSRRNERVRQCLALEPQDVFIPGGYLSESDMMLRDPVAWVNKYVDEQRTIEA